MKIRIIAIGKIKEKYLRDGISEYIKRITPYTQIEIVEVEDSPICNNPKQFDIDKAKEIECEKALKYVKTNDYLITLDMNKKEYFSEEFAVFLSKKLEIGGSQITFLIGGSYGLSEKAKNRANDSISLSKMTFLHQMTRLILLEQIYRAFKINHNEVYHK